VDTSGQKIGHEPVMSACSPERQSYPVLHKEKHGQQIKGSDSSPLLCSGDFPHLESCIQLWSPQHRKDMDLLDQIQRRAIKIVKGMNTFPVKKG